MFGRRPDGKRVRDVDPIVQVTPYLMPMRCDAQVFLEHKLDYEMLSRYIVRKAQEGQKVTFMHLIAAAYVRAVSQHPEVNLSFAVLKNPQDPESPESTVRIKFDPTDTLFDVRDRMTDAVEKCREAKDDEFLIKLARFVLAVPGFTTFIVGVARLLDRYGLLPKFLIDELPFYSGLFITNNASIGLHHVWHHIYNFGNVSLFMGLGSVLKEAFTDSEGKTRMRRLLPIGMTADERVCSGAHYAAFFAAVMHGLAHPEELEVPPESVKYDKGVEYHVEKLNKG